MSEYRWTESISVWGLASQDEKEVRVLVTEALPQIRDGKIEYPVVLTTADVPKFDEVAKGMATLRTKGVVMNSPPPAEAIVWIATLEDPFLQKRVEGLGAGIHQVFVAVGAHLAHNSFMFNGYARGPWEVAVGDKSKTISLKVSTDQIGRWIGRGGCHIKAVRQILGLVGWKINLS